MKTINRKLYECPRTTEKLNARMNKQIIILGITFIYYEYLFSKRLMGRNHFHIVLRIFGTALNPRLRKLPLYMLLNIDFDVFIILF